MIISTYLTFPKKSMDYFTTNPSQTKKLGEILAKEVLKTKPKRKALSIGLEGDLGGGKTTFLQGFAKGLGIREKILSPTFVIMRKSKIQNPKSKYQNFYHIDCYRIKELKEILDLGFRKIISEPQNIVAIEWSDKIQKIMPEDTIWISFELVNKNKREIVIKPR